MTTPDCDTSMMLDDEPLLRGDLVFAIARAASQDSVLALRATGKSLSHQVEPKWAFTHLAPRSKLTQELIKRYSSCQHLSLHRIEGTLDAEDIRLLAGFPALQSLTLGCEVSPDAGCAFLEAIGQALASLQSLSLRGSRKLPWTGLDNLSTLTGLTSLDLTGVQHPQTLAATGPRAPRFPLLRSLTLGDGKALSYLPDATLHSFVKTSPQIEELSLAGCIDITDAGIQALTALAPTLTHLSLQSCVRLTQHGLPATLTQLSNLQSLNLRGCLQLTDGGLEKLSVLTSLRELNIQACTGIYGAGFAKLSTLKQLHTLNARDCSTLESLTGIAWLNSLKSLDLSRCVGLKAEALLMLGHLNKLTDLTMTGLKLPGKTPHTPQLNADLEKWLTLLKRIQKLDISDLKHAHGVPPGLLRAIGRMTTLTHLTLTNVNPPLPDTPPQPQQPAQPASTAAAASKESYDTPAAARAAIRQLPQLAVASSRDHCGACRRAAARGPCTDQLSFLLRLTQLEYLDLNGWSGLCPCALAYVAHLSKLTELRLNRLGNDQLPPVPAQTNTPHHQGSNQRPAPDHFFAPGMGPGAAAAGNGDGGGNADECDVRGGAADGKAAPAATPQYPLCACERVVVRGVAGAWRGSDLAGCIVCAECLTASGVPKPVMNLADQLAAVHIKNTNNTNTNTTSNASSSGSRGSSSKGAHSTTHSKQVMDIAASIRRSVHAATSAARGDADTAALDSLLDGDVGSVRDVRAEVEFKFNCAMGYLRHLVNLERLSLNACTWLTDQGLASALPRSSPIQTLSICGCKKLTGLALYPLARAAANFHTLIASDCSGLAEHAVATALPRFARLTRLDLGGCGLGGDVVCDALCVSGARYLEDVSLRGCHKMDNRAVSSLAQAAPRLRTLNLSNCWPLDDTGLTSLLTHSHSLTSLDIGHCWRITPAAAASAQARVRAYRPGQHAASGSLCGAKGAAVQGCETVRDTECVRDVGLSVSGGEVDVPVVPMVVVGTSA